MVGIDAATPDYDSLAATYAAANDTGLFNAWYATPEMVRLAGDVEARESSMPAAATALSCFHCVTVAPRWLGSISVPP